MCSPIEFMCNLQSGFTLETSAGLCLPCHGARQNFPVLAFAVLFAVFFALALARRFGGAHNNNSCIGQLLVLQFILQIDKGMVKIILATFQIVLSISWNLRITFPVPTTDHILDPSCMINSLFYKFPFSSMLRFLSPLQMEFLSLACAR